MCGRAQTRNRTIEATGTLAVTLKGFLRGLKRTPEARDAEPIRGELYSVERLAQYAATLAAERGRAPLLKE